MRQWKEILNDYIYRFNADNADDDAAQESAIKEFTAYAKDEFTQEDWDEFIEFIESVIADLNRSDYE